jgi:hypothetical protein
MRRLPHPSLRGAVRAVRLAKPVLVGATAFVAVTAAGTASGTAGSVTGSASDVGVAQELSAAAAGQARLDRLMARHDCSATGFEPGVVPGSSLVLRDDEVRHVSFDEGWAIYTGEQAGTLLAVCLATVQPG